MKYLEILNEIANKQPDSIALVVQHDSNNSTEVSYGDIQNRILQIRNNISCIPDGSVVALRGDYDVETIAYFFALVQKQCVLVPVSDASKHQVDEYISISEANFLVKAKSHTIKTLSVSESTNSLYRLLENKAGLVVFSSGSSGKPKGILHKLEYLFQKYLAKRYAGKMIGFLVFDHLGGLNTLFYSLANHGTIVFPYSHSLEAVSRVIDQWGVEVLPTTPSFLSKLVRFASERQIKIFSKLKKITYGTEMMPEITLKRIVDIFPNVILQQTYGLSEVGVLSSVSKSNASLWVKVGGKNFETKIVNKQLWIKARSSMLGYLNAPSPFDCDGWFNTEDQVDNEGEYIRILGRNSDLINVAGLKVYPAEIESILMQIESVLDCLVYGKEDILVGNKIEALVQIESLENKAIVRSKIETLLKKEVQKYKWPSRIKFTINSLVNTRQKKNRNISGMKNNNSGGI